jgi:hypothetical protein
MTFHFIMHTLLCWKGMPGVGGDSVKTVIPDEVDAVAIWLLPMPPVYAPPSVLGSSFQLSKVFVVGEVMIKAVRG